MKTTLAKRTGSAVVIILICAALLFTGGWVYAIGLSLVLATATWEYARLFEKGNYAPAKILISLGTFLIALTGSMDDSLLTQGVTALVILSIIGYHTITYKNHKDTAAFDLAISLAGIMFIAFIGYFLVKLRFLPDGLFWVIQCVAPAGISDVGAFFIGSAFGRHKIAPDLSPKKTVEGYLGGVFTAVVFGYGLGAGLAAFNPQFSGSRGLLIGLVVGAICPMGDFAKSIFKRQFNLKNTGNLIPGHGGILDRIDTWLIAGITSYFMIQIFFL
jgi:phosphatidate cytidylyltransferase